MNEAHACFALGTSDLSSMDHARPAHTPHREFEIHSRIGPDVHRAPPIYYLRHYSSKTSKQIGLTLVAFYLGNQIAI